MNLSQNRLIEKNNRFGFYLLMSMMIMLTIYLKFRSLEYVIVILIGFYTFNLEIRRLFFLMNLLQHFSMKFHQKVMILLRIVILLLCLVKFLSFVVKERYIISHIKKTFHMKNFTMNVQVIKLNVVICIFQKESFFSFSLFKLSI